MTLPITAPTLYQRAERVAADLIQHEVAGHHIALAVFELERDLNLARLRDTAIPYLKPLLVSYGVSEGSVSYYLAVGTALAAGMAKPEPSPVPGQAAPLPPSNRDLRAAGTALRNGAPPSEVKAAVQAGTIRDYSHAQQNAGTVEIRLNLAVKPTWDEQVRRWRSLTGLGEQEAQALMVTALPLIPDSDVQKLARAGEVKA